MKLVLSVQGWILVLQSLILKDRSIKYLSHPNINEGIYLPDCEVILELEIVMLQTENMYLNIITAFMACQIYISSTCGQILIFVAVRTLQLIIFTFLFLIALSQ